MPGAQRGKDPVPDELRNGGEKRLTFKKVKPVSRTIEKRLRMLRGRLGGGGSRNNEGFPRRIRGRQTGKKKIEMGRRPATLTQIPNPG